MTASGSDPADARTQWSERVEKSILGEAFISAVVASVVIIGVVFNLPDSALRRAAQPTVLPIAGATGIDSSWQMYAPDPIQRLERLTFRMTMADGSLRDWEFRSGDDGFGPLSWSRWQKLKEQSIRTPAIRAGFADWMVRHVSTDGERPVRVQMILRTEDLIAPGRYGEPGAGEEVLYDQLLDEHR